MNVEFSNLVNQLPALLDMLLECNPSVGTATQPSDLPKRGVYLFSDQDRHLYVGRTNRLKARLKEHLKGRNNDAPFAFKMARHKTGNLKKKGGLTRKALEVDPDFATAFSQSKNEIALMQWRWVRIDDPNLQCLFEIYATIALNAQFNDFENH